MLEFDNGFNEIIAMDDGVSLKYMFTDALGSVTAVYDAATSTAEFTTYDAYGNSETAPASPYGYAGMRAAMFTDNCSLYLTPNRAYSPKLGRWLRPDPLGTTPNPQTGNVYSPLKQYTDGTNLYAYVQNNPINERDDWGLKGSIPDPWQDPIDRACSKGNWFQRFMCRLTYRCLMKKAKTAACQVALTACNADCAVLYDDPDEAEQCIMYCSRGYAKCIK